MIDGLKLAMSGDEVISLLDARIDRIRATVEDEIRQHEHRIRVLTIVREHVLRDETYLIGQKDLEFAELLPEPPPAQPDTGFPGEIRWVTHPVDVSAAVRGTCCPGD